MAIDIKFDLVGNPEPPTIILAKRNGDKLGQLNVDPSTIDLSDKFNDVSEFAFTLNKYIDGELTWLWNEVVDFKLVYCKEWDMWFEIKVELDETTEVEVAKTVFCTQLGQAELSQIMMYNLEINTDKDIERDDYKASVLYDKDFPDASILSRMLEKAPHYSIAHVDSTIADIQRTFSFDGVSICDGFQEVSNEIGCLFVYNSNSGEKGEIQRTISVYDLQQNCNDCGYRGEFTDKCPECDSTNIKYGYGEDTLIFVTSDELATEGIQVTADTESVKNCFKLKAGDDLLTATVRNCNPNGTDYIWRFSSEIKKEMSEDLVEKLEDYDKDYEYYYNESVSNIDTNMLSKYNALVNKYSTYNKDLQKINTPIVGYPDLMNAYYNTVDLGLYLKSGLMPSVEMSDTTAAQQAALLTASALSPVAVNTDNLSSVSVATANSAVLSMAKILVRSTYKVEVKDSTLSNDKVWEGSFTVTNYSDEEDTAESQTIKITINNDSETFIKQKINKALNKEDTDDYSISGLFKKDYGNFCAELKKYALNPLKSFYDACDVCLDILIDQGAGNKDEKPDLYNDLYVPYYDKSSAITAEIKIREDEIAIIEGVWDTKDEANPKLITKGLQQLIEERRNEIQDILDFQKYVGEELWIEFCTFRRDDTYSNDNYISDGLNNAELFDKAMEFYDVAKNEIYKASELQYSISTTLNNLLAIPKFKSLTESFKLGNWIRVQVDDAIYRLRLLEYGIDFGDFNNISVEFSDVTKIKNGMTDLKDILGQASSISTSYEGVKRQSEQGEKVKGTIDQWLANGLNSALVRIQSNDSEEITLSKSGLLCRSYDDITESYSPEQYRLTHNIMAYTTDNWKTVSAALGKHDYVRWRDDQWFNDTDYGLSAKFVTAGYIAGSQIIGGEIVSSNYKAGKNGTYFNLIDGNFDIAGGKIAYNSNNGKLTLRGVSIEWDTSTQPKIENVEGLSEYIDQLDKAKQDIIDISAEISLLETNAEGWANDAKDYADDLSDELTKAYKTYTNTKISELDSSVAKYLTAGGKTMIGADYLISPYIAGGYLNITGANNNIKVLIDPSNLTGNGYVFQVHNGNTKKVVVGVDKNGNALFDGKIYANEGDIGGWEIKGWGIVKTATVNGVSRTTGLQNASSGAIAFAVGAINADNWSTAPFYITHSGDIHAESGDIGGWAINKDYLGSYGGTGGYYYLSRVGKRAWVSGAPDLKDGNESYRDCMAYFNGKFAVDIYGNMYATGGTIGGWDVYGTYIGSTEDEGAFYITSVKDKIQNSSVQYWLRAHYNNSMPFYVTREGKLFANKAEIKGTITATDGAIAGWNLTPSYYKCSLLYANKGAMGTGMAAANEDDYMKWLPAFWAGYSGAYSNPYSSQDAVWAGTTTEKWDKVTSFYVTHGGELHATGAIISGSITATSGTIGDCTIDANGKLTVPAANISSLTVDKIQAGTNNNAVNFTNITATGGKVGGWSISSTQLSATNGNTYISSDGTFVFYPQDNNYVGLMLNSVTNKYHFVIGSNCKLQFGETILTEDELKKLKKLI